MLTAERERIRKRLEAVIERGFWSQLATVEQELLKCVEEGEMKQLREKVTIRTPLGIIHGHLFVGRGHLPECEVAVLDSWGNERRFTPSSFPDAWTLEQAEPSEVILLHTWLAISEMQSEIAAAQREEEKQ